MVTTLPDKPPAATDAMIALLNGVGAALATCPPNVNFALSDIVGAELGKCEFNQAAAYAVADAIRRCAAAYANGGNDAEANAAIGS